LGLRDKQVNTTNHITSCHVIMMYICVCINRCM
jgi:hypothetical protein